MIDDDVAGLSGSGGANHAGAGDNLANEGVLLLGDVHLDLGLVPVTAHNDKNIRHSQHTGYYISARYNRRLDCVP